MAELGTHMRLRLSSTKAGHLQSQQHPGHPDARGGGDTGTAKGPTSLPVLLTRQSLVRGEEKGQAMCAFPLMSRKQAQTAAPHRAAGDGGRGSGSPCELWGGAGPPVSCGEREQVPL